METIAQAIQMAPGDLRCVSPRSRAFAAHPRPAPGGIRPRDPRALQTSATSHPNAHECLNRAPERLETDLRRVLDSLSTSVVDTTAERSVQRIDQIERDTRRQMADLERVARLVDEMNSRQRLDGRAEYATTELDRRVREIERLVSTLQREVSSLNNDVRSLQRSVGRPLAHQQKPRSEEPACGEHI